MNKYYLYVTVVEHLDALVRGKAESASKEYCHSYCHAMMPRKVY